MKKLLFISISLLFISSFSKQYNCECQYYNDEEGNMGGIQTIDAGYQKNKKEAKTYCTDRSYAPDGLNNGRKCDVR